MTVVTETPVEAYKFCSDSACPGYGQEPADCILQEVVHSYGDSGSTDGLAGFPQRSNHYLRFASEGDSICSFCDGPMQCSQQERPVYPKMAPTDPNRQADQSGQLMDHVLRQERKIAEIEAKQGTESAMAARIAELEAELGIGEVVDVEPVAPAKRGPGRPRRDQSDA